MMSSARSTTLPHALLWYGRSVATDDPLVVELMASATIDAADVRTLDGATLTVKELRELRRFAHQSPAVSSHRLMLIGHADRLSIPVANALLKLIEEPPAHLLIRLSARTLAAVLPTIRSRCQLVFVGAAIVTDDRFPLAELDRQSISQRFALADQLSQDDQLEAVVVSWLRDLETRLLRDEPVGARIHAAQQLLERLATNANRRLALEAWFMGKTNQ